MKAKNQQSGYIILMSILIVSAVGLVIATTYILLGISVSNSSFSFEQSMHARILADSCVEEALQELRENEDYTGSDGLTQGQGSCTYTVTNEGGDLRKIEAVGTVGTVTRRVKVETDGFEPVINISTWEELGEF